MPSLILLLLFHLALLPLLTLTTPAPNPHPLPLPAKPAYPTNSTCLCSERAPLDYTISLWIVDKTTTEDDALSQGLRDNFATFCKGYYVLWSDTVPIVTDRVSGSTYPAATAPQTMGGKIELGWAELTVTGYVVGLDLEGKRYDGCLTRVVEAAEKMGVRCSC